ncbi:MAG: hypothetical protein AAGC63_06205, partial [Propionicimonas sp.]
MQSMEGRCLMGWTVTAERRPSGWILQCDELPAAIAPVARLDLAVATMAQEISRVAQAPVEESDIRLQPVLPGAVAQAMSRAAQLREEAARATSEAARLTRVAATLLKGEGLTMRDIGSVMGVSAQRANQLVAQSADAAAAKASDATLFDVDVDATSTSDAAVPTSSPARSATEVPQAREERTPEPEGNPEPVRGAASIPASTEAQPAPQHLVAGEDRAREPGPEPGQRPARTGAARTAPAAGAAVPSRGAAVVVDVETMYLPDGTTRPSPAVRHLGDLAQIGYDLQLGVQVVAPSGQMRGRADAGAVVVTGALAAQLDITTSGLPRDGARRGEAFATAHTDHPALRAALGDGWEVTEKVGTNLRGWTKMWRRGGASIYVAFADLLPPSVRAEDADPATIARRLGLYAGVLGTAFHVSAHATGHDLMRALRAKGSTEFVTHEPPTPALSLGDPDISGGWSRQPVDDAEAALPYVHAYDRGGAHLAGVAGLELPVGDPTHYASGTDFDHRLPGYWLVTIPESGDWRYPHPLYKPRYRDFDWVTTPALAFAAERGFDLEVVEAYVWHDHARVLDPWYKRLAAARTATDDQSDPDLAAVRTMIKETYTRSIGMMGSREHAKGTSTFQPERRHHIVAKARATLLRRIT